MPLEIQCLQNFDIGKFLLDVFAALKPTTSMLQSQMMDLYTVVEMLTTSLWTLKEMSDDSYKEGLSMLHKLYFTVLYIGVPSAACEAHCFLCRAFSPLITDQCNIQDKKLFILAHEKTINKSRTLINLFQNLSRFTVDWSCN